LGGAALPPTPLTAAVTATDSDLDVAVLAISATELPYLALGDSTLVERGQPVEVLGYPFGKAIDAVLGNAHRPARGRRSALVGEP
jgi:S1-C subfamily serine protease